MVFDYYYVWWSVWFKEHHSYLQNVRKCILKLVESAVLPSSRFFCKLCPTVLASQSLATGAFPCMYRHYQLPRSTLHLQGRLCMLLLLESLHLQGCRTKESQRSRSIESALPPRRKYTNKQCTNNQTHMLHHFSRFCRSGI